MLGAYHAAHAGLEVLLLDQHESRQDRAAGDALFPRAVAEVSLMGLADWLERPNYYKYEGIVVYARTAHLCEPNSPTNRHGVRGVRDPLVRDCDAAAGEGTRGRHDLPGRRQGKVPPALRVECREWGRGG